MLKTDIILDVHDSRSISKTAEKHNYSQSAVSQAISSYEKELGIKLFKRSKNGMEPLPGTAGIFEELRNIHTSDAHIQELAAGLHNLESGFIRIGTIQSIAYHWLPGILKKFSTEYPGIKFELYVEGFTGLKKQLREKQLDCIFISEYSASGLDFIPVGDDELMLVTPMNHPLAKKLSVSFSEINGRDFILGCDDVNYEAGDLIRSKHLTPNVRFRINEDYTAIKMVEEGFGITVLPALLLHNVPFEVCVRSFTEHYQRVLGLALPESQEPMPALRKFIDFTVEWSRENGLV
jgi:DNA-binding transcriptional LysR family regulator